MYNKIASIILNSGKAAGLSDVFVSQPDALKENLAGKVFILAEIPGKKTESRKVFNWLVSNLEDNYYNDEKIMLRGKIEGLKIENIFEAALAKTNKSLLEFLTDAKIKINLAATNITLGVIYENHLHFSSFGKNRALLIYRRGEEYEIINVEANAAEISEHQSTNDAAAVKIPKLFSSVISGEVPLGSYFIFTSEALPEYLSGKEMISVITKLPPIVAAEQIKNVLGKMNTFIPFLGVIIKNTAGLNSPEIKEEPEESLSAHSSISSLNYTEQKTEQMLSPAGLINFSKIFKFLKRLFKALAPKPPARPKKTYKPEEDRRSATQPSLELGQVKSLNLARADSFMVKEKIFFKKRNNRFIPALARTVLSVPRIFSPRLWTGFFPNLGGWLKNLNRKNRLLIVGLALVVIIFILSLAITSWNRKQQALRTDFNNQVTKIEDRENLIDSHLLYNDEDGAKQLLIEAQALLAALPQTKAYEKDSYQRLAVKLQEQADKVQKIVKVNNLEKVNDLSGLGVLNLAFAAGKIYAATGKTIYTLTPNAASSTRTEIASATALTEPRFDRKGIIYYWDSNKIIQFNIKTLQSSSINITGSLDPAAGLTGFEVFNGNLYIVAKNQNQIYRYSRDKSGYGVKADWLKDVADLSQATDFTIDGNIYVLKSSGEVLKFYKNKKADYAAGPISPAMTGANKIITGTKYVYIFEASSKRLAVLALKDGHLMNQYQISPLQSPQDFTVDEAGKAAYFLDGEAVYKINLNQ